MDPVDPDPDLDPDPQHWDPDPDSLETLDPDPYPDPDSMTPDSQLCFVCMSADEADDEENWEWECNYICVQDSLKN